VNNSGQPIPHRLATTLARTTCDPLLIEGWSCEFLGFAANEN
jgi:hypothetical protein